ncbi:hypothetical protein ES705_47215 [subsurface metagenome]
MLIPFGANTAVGSVTIAISHLSVIPSLIKASVPKPYGPSSSTTAVNNTFPLNWLSIFFNSSIAIIAAASPDFISRAPWPYNLFPSTLAPRGSLFQPSHIFTVSICALRSIAEPLSFPISAMTLFPLNLLIFFSETLWYHGFRFFFSNHFFTNFAIFSSSNQGLEIFTNSLINFSTLSLLISSINSL